MRISTANAFDAGIDALSRRQTDLQSLQEQMTTGKPGHFLRRAPSTRARWR